MARTEWPEWWSDEQEAEYQEALALHTSLRQNLGILEAEVRKTRARATSARIRLDRLAAIRDGQMTLPNT